MFYTHHLMQFSQQSFTGVETEAQTGPDLLELTQQGVQIHTQVV